MFFPKQFTVGVLTAIKCDRVSLGWCVRPLGLVSFHFLSFPKQFTAGSLLEERLAAICSVPDMPWPRSWSLSAMCLPCVRCGGASKPCPPARSLSAVLCHVLAFVSTVRSTMCPLKPWPCLWILSPLGLLWGATVASSSRILSHHCAAHAYIIWHARQSGSLAFILVPQIRPLQALPMLEKLFGSMLV